MYNHQYSGVTFFVCFRVGNRTYVNVSPKLAGFEGKYGQLYASKEKLYARQNGFMIPKASPLEASYDLLLYKVNISCMSIDFRETSNGQYFHGWKWE